MDKIKKSETKKKKAAKSIVKAKKSETSVKTKKKVAKKENKNLKWYVINSYAGHEKKVMKNIEQRIKANQAEDLITDVVVPTQNKIIIKEGKKKTIEDRFFPGYILIRMDLNDVTWHIIRNAEGVTGFVGTERKPTPLSEIEAEGIMKYMQVEQPAYQSTFMVGDAVKIVDGPFTDFVGSVRDINETKGKVQVLISVFGRETPVDLDFLQVKKL